MGSTEPRHIQTPLGRVELREGVVDDVEAYCALKADVLAEGDWFITEVDEFDASEGINARLLHSLIESDNSCFLTAWIGAGLAGALLVQGGHLRRIQHVGKLEIYVGEECRGMGVGKALLQAVLEWAEANEAVSKLSLAVFAHNEGAVRLYERFGFETEGRRLNEYKMADGTYRDDLLMARSV
jgi:ribosomal protein S18 acetylase RimI-like enzyme